MCRYRIINANIFRPDFEFHKGTLEILNGVIVPESQGDSDIKIIDAEGLYLIPGLTDIHFHGCNGHDFSEGTQEAFQAISDYEESVGVTRICPATMTLPENHLAKIMTEAKKFHSSHENLIGIYLEGPFISEHKIGAQNPKFIHKPDIKLLENLQNLSGNLIRVAVIAPEVEGGMNFIEHAKNITKLSLGHSVSNYKTAKKAFDIGVNQVTHLFNAMNPIHHRDPGPIVAALENKNVMVELICDGVHVHPSIVRETLKLFGDDRVIFISDSMEATGMKDGNYKLGGLDVIKSGNTAKLKDGTIAGSVTNLFDCMRNSVVKMGVKLETAIKCACVNPIKAVKEVKEVNADSYKLFCEKNFFTHIRNFILLDSDLFFKTTLTSLTQNP